MDLYDLVAEGYLDIDAKRFDYDSVDERDQRAIARVFEEVDQPVGYRYSTNDRHPNDYRRFTDG